MTRFLWPSVAGAITIAASVSAQCVEYRVTPVTSGPVFNGDAFGINDQGEISGWILFAPTGVQRIFRWSEASGMTLLPTPQGWTQAHGGTISAGGLTAGYVYGHGSPLRAVRWSPDGAATVLPVPPGTTLSDAGRIHASGMIPGYAQPHGALIWTNDGYISLESPDMMATAMNDAQVVVGYRRTFEPTRAVRWLPEQGPQLLPLPQSGESLASDLNNHGLIVGFADLSGPGQVGRRAALWDDDLFVDLHPGGPFELSMANACNDDGAVVGHTWYPVLAAAVCWNPQRRPTLLTHALRAADADWTIHAAWDINQDGLIAATAKKDNYYGPVLLTPLPIERTADLNGDGVVDFADLLHLLSHWGETSDHLGPPDPLDFDCNGAIDLADIMYLLSNWS